MTRRYSSTMGVEYRRIERERETPFHAARGGLAIAADRVLLWPPSSRRSRGPINHWLDDHIGSIVEMDAADAAVMDWDDASEGTPPSVRGRRRIADR